MDVPPRRRWLELAGDHRCNNRCLGCFSSSGDEANALTSDDLVRSLREGRRLGCDAFWFGGGEPTMRRDVFAVVNAARRLGYVRAKLQTNGMMLAYGDFATRCARAGVTEVAFSLKGASADTHDRLTGTPGCFELLERGIAQARAQGLEAEGDVLLYASNVHELPAIVQRFHALGLVRFRVWTFATFDQRGDSLAHEIPRVTDVVHALERAFALGLSDAPDFLVSLHTPPCTIPEAHARARFFAPDLGLIVMEGGGRWFPLEQSPMEGGNYLASCEECALRARCGGIRADYLARFGGDEFVPVSPLNDGRRA